MQPPRSEMGIVKRIGFVVACLVPLACSSESEEAGTQQAPDELIEPLVETPSGVPDGLESGPEALRCATDSEGPPEVYFPDAMNSKLVRFPILRERTGLSEVSGCAEAGKFMESYRTILDTEPEILGVSADAEMNDIDVLPASEDVDAASYQSGESGTVRQPILNGALATAHYATVRISNNIGEVCSGVAVSKFHALTSAHCLGSSEGWFRGAISRQVCFGSSCIVIPTLYTEMWLYLSRHPEYAGVGDWADDIAMVTIYHAYDDGTVEFPSPGAGNAMRIWLGSLSSGQSVDVYGFGASSTGGAGYNVLEQGSMSLAAVNSGYFWANVGTQSTCLGDSGGPAVVSTDKAAGLASAQSSGEHCPPSGGWVTWTRLNAKMSWIDSQMGYPFGSGYKCNRYSSGSSLYARCW